MSIFDTKKNSAICVLPWVHEYKKTNGKTAPCCQGDTLQDNETLESIRQQMLEGNKPRACNNCYLKENETNYSPRIQETVDWLKKFGEPDIKKPTLQHIDVRFDPTCNLKCKMCGPGNSTLWQKEKKVNLPVNDLNKDYLYAVDKTLLKKVYLAGGEPTFIKGYYTFLDNLHQVNPDCEVVVNTNLKKLPDNWKAIIKKFKNLTIVCSCDAIGTLGTYTRYPLGWGQFEENVKFVSKHANFLQFNLVAYNLTSHKLYETCEWMRKYSNNINLIILDNPNHFTERAVPHADRNVYMDNINRLKNFPVSVHYAMNFRKKIQYLLKKYNDSVYDEELHYSLRQEINEQDSHRSLKLNEVDPFLSAWVHG
jgi:organic radical activating enzyme